MPDRHQAMYEALDKKDRGIIRALCPQHILEEITWYDTSQAGDEVQNACRYLKLRGLLKHHPTVYNLVRFTA